MGFAPGSVKLGALRGEVGDIGDVDGFIAEVVRFGTIWEDVEGVVGFVAGVTLFGVLCGGVGGVMGLASGSVRLGAFNGDVEDLESGEGAPWMEGSAATDEDIKIALNKNAFFIDILTYNFKIPYNGIDDKFIFLKFCECHVLSILLNFCDRAEDVFYAKRSTLRRFVSLHL